MIRLTIDDEARAPIGMGTRWGTVCWRGRDLCPTLGDARLARP